MKVETKKLEAQMKVSAAHLARRHGFSTPANMGFTEVSKVFARLSAVNSAGSVGPRPALEGLATELRLGNFFR